MGKRLKGEVTFIRTNYGEIKTTIDNINVKLYFIVKPEMVANGYFLLGKKVSFETRNVTVRGVNVVEAFSLLPDVENAKPIKIINKINFESLNKYGYKTIYKGKKYFNNEINNDLIEEEKEIDLLLFKWILYLEKETKLFVNRILKENKISSSDFIKELKNNKKTNKTIKEVFKKLKDDFIFRKESDSILFKNKPEDPNDVDIENIPILMFLEQLTISELSNVVSICNEKYASLLSEDDCVLLSFITNMLPDIAFMRNKIAHGNLFLPLIADDSFSPSYFYEMASAFPEWNSNKNLNDVRKYPAFEFIRFNTRMLAKEGINLAGINAPLMIIGLFFTKSLLINEAKKSLFSLVFLLMSIFSYFDDSFFKDFTDDLDSCGMFPTVQIRDCLLTKFPTEHESVFSTTYRLLLPIFGYCRNPILFKTYSKICFNLQTQKNRK